MVETLETHPFSPDCLSISEPQKKSRGHCLQLSTMSCTVDVSLNYKLTSISKGEGCFIGKEGNACQQK
jgi:hypothetical protein